MPRMGSRRNKGATANVVFLALACATALLFVASIDVIFLRTPIEKQMGIVQKIFYFHVPAACALYLGGAACFGGSVAYLLRPTEVRDAIARSGAELAVVFGATALTMGLLGVGSGADHVAPVRAHLHRVLGAAEVLRRRRG